MKFALYIPEEQPLGDAIGVAESLGAEAACHYSADDFVSGLSDPNVIGIFTAKREIDGIGVTRFVRGLNLKNILFCMFVRPIHPRVLARLLFAGADQVQSWPIDRRLLGAFIEALERRERPPEQAKTFCGFTFQAGNGRLHFGPSEIHLTGKEADVIRILADRPGSVVSRKALHSALYPGADAANEKTIDVFVTHIRKKLAQVCPSLVIGTAWGQGFYLNVGSGPDAT